MSKSQIQIAKPDKSRSCLHCRHSWMAPELKSAEFIFCKRHEEGVPHAEAQTCPDYRDSRQTSQVISAGGKVGPA